MRQIANARASDPVLFNPIYVHGGNGRGKTHLLQALTWEALSNGRRALYLSGDRFIRISRQSVSEFDIIVVDDLQSMSFKSARDEFALTLNTMVNAGRQVVISSDRPIRDHDGFDDVTMSRLAGGIVLELGALSDEVRRGIARARLGALNATIPDDVFEYVTSAILHGGRDIEGAINRLATHHQFSSDPLNVEIARGLIRDFIRTETKRLKIEDIQAVVARKYAVRRADMLSARRTANVVRPRQIAMYIAKTLTPRSLPEIGRLFGGRDHTTVLHAVRKIEALAGRDADLNAEIESIKHELRG
jgi:chromosomal replication initiator protein